MAESSTQQEEYDCSADAVQCCGDFEDLAKAYKALSHPARLMILFELENKQTQCCGEICHGLPLAQSTVSQHLKTLRDNGFIELETVGQQSHYRVNREKIDWVLGMSQSFFCKLK